MQLHKQFHYPFQTLEQAIEVKQQGADIIVAQATEAGGHGSTKPLQSLLPEVINALPEVPIVAAGGLVDGHDVREVISQVAQGAFLGTRYYACEKSLGTVEQMHRIV